jgi:hypothetical protein
MVTQKCGFLDILLKSCFPFPQRGEMLNLPVEGADVEPSPEEPVGGRTSVRCLACNACKVANPVLVLVVGQSLAVRKNESLEEYEKKVSMSYLEAAVCKEERRILWRLI